MGMLDGRVVIVTGAGRGLGRCHALELARHGAMVVVNDVGSGVKGEGADLSPAEQVVAEIVNMGGAAYADGTSVSDFAATKAMIDRAVETFGRLDVVVNNAGILRDRMLTAMTEEDFDAVINVHLKGTFCVTRHACEYWKTEAKANRDVSGRVINTTSGTGLFGNVGQSNYGAAKAGIVSFTQITAMEMDRYGVTANAISPVARTRMTEALPSFARQEGSFDKFDPANASPVVAYLASKESGWLTGTVFRVDGDRIQRMKPFDVDAAVDFATDEGAPLDATKLNQRLRMAMGLFPPGAPSVRKY